MVLVSLPLSAGQEPEVIGNVRPRRIKEHDVSDRRLYRKVCSDRGELAGLSCKVARELAATLAKWGARSERRCGAQGPLNGGLRAAPLRGIDGYVRGAGRRSRRSRAQSTLTRFLEQAGNETSRGDPPTGQRRLAAPRARSTAPAAYVRRRYSARDGERLVARRRGSASAPDTRTPKSPSDQSSDPR